MHSNNRTVTNSNRTIRQQTVVCILKSKDLQSVLQLLAIQCKYASKTWELRHSVGKLLFTSNKLHITSYFLLHLIYYSYILLKIQCNLMILHITLVTFSNLIILHIKLLRYVLIINSLHYMLHFDYFQYINRYFRYISLHYRYVILILCSLLVTKCMFTKVTQIILLQFAMQLVILLQFN